MNSFPGVGRRFEKIADGLYTDYAHHPEEIVATIEADLWMGGIEKDFARSSVAARFWLC